MIKVVLAKKFRTLQPRSENTMFVILLASNLLVAVTGFAKDLFTAGYLGTTALADAFASAYYIVDTLSVSVLATALWIGAAAAFGVAGHQYSGKTHRASVRIGILYSTSSAFLLCVVLIGLRHPLVRLLSDSSQSGLLMDRVYLVLLPLALTYPVSMVVTGALQASGSYVVSTMAPAWLNLCVVCAAGLCTVFRVNQTHGMVLVALAYSVGGVVMFGLLLGAWIRWEKSRHLVVQWNDTFRFYSRETLLSGFRVSVGYASYLALQQLVGFVERHLSVGLGSGSVAALTYAYRISQVPNWIVVSAMMTMVLPNVAAALDRRDSVAATALVKNASHLVFMICLPMAIMLSLWARPIVSLLLERGAFGHDSVKVTAEFLSTYAWGIVTQAMATILFRTVASTGKMQWPIVSAVVGTTINVLFDVVMLPQLGAKTFGAGSCLGGISSCFILGLRLYRDGGVRAWLSKRDLLRVFLGNTLVAFACELVNIVGFTHEVDLRRFNQSVVLLMAAMCVGIMYVAVMSAGGRWKRVGVRIDG